MSLRSLYVSDTSSGRSSPVTGQPQVLGKSYSSSPRHSVYYTPRQGRRTTRGFFKKTSFFSNQSSQEEKELPRLSFLGQIYRDTKFKLSRSFHSQTSSSSQVSKSASVILLIGWSSLVRLDQFVDAPLFTFFSLAPLKTYLKSIFKIRAIQANFNNVKKHRNYLHWSKTSQD